MFCSEIDRTNMIVHHLFCIHSVPSLNKSYQSMSYEVTFTRITHKEIHNLLTLSKGQCKDIIQLTGNIEMSFFFVGKQEILSCHVCFSCYYDNMT